MASRYVPVLRLAVGEYADVYLGSLRGTSDYAGAPGRGTPSYTSPEQASGQLPTLASDAFSLAVVLYEMLAGKRLFEGESAEQVLHLVRSARVQLPGSLGPVRDVLSARLVGSPSARAADLKTWRRVFKISRVQRG